VTWESLNLNTRSPENLIGHMKTQKLLETLIKKGFNVTIADEYIQARVEDETWMIFPIEKIYDLFCIMEKIGTFKKIYFVATDEKIEDTPVRSLLNLGVGCIFFNDEVEVYEPRKPAVLVAESKRERLVIKVTENLLFRFRLFKLKYRFKTNADVLKALLDLADRYYVGYLRRVR